MILCLTGTVVALQQTMVVPLLPDFPEILGVSTDDASWLITATLLTSAVATPIVSRLADMFGKRRMMIASMTMMVIGSLTAAIGGDFPALVAGRALQGFAISLIPVGISILRDELPKEKVASATALMSATLGIGSALGLPLSGVIYEHLGWEANFWFSAVVGVLLMGAVLAIVPESAVRTRGRFDFLGAVLLSIALAALLLAISKGGSWGWGSEPTILVFITAVVVLAIWFPYELRVNHPLVDLRTSARRPVLLTNVASVLVGFAMYANMLSTTQQLQMPKISGYGLELGVLTAGLCMVPAGIAMVVLSPVSAAITRRFGAQTTLITGAVILAAAYAGRVFLTGSIAMIILGAVVVNIGTTIAYGAMPTLIMRSVPITETASANGLNSLLRSFGTATSSAVVAAILTSMTFQAGPLTLPTLGAFKNVFWSASVAALAAAAVALFIPRRGVTSVTGDAAVTAATLPGAGRSGADTAPARAAEAGGEEIMVSGTVLREDLRPIRQAVVTILDTHGEAVDWSRADNDGAFSLVLPGPGRYLVVTSADGWAPHSEVLEFLDPETRHRIRLSERLTISGRLSAGTLALDHGLVALTKPTGECVSTVFSDTTGCYELALPPVGRYVLTMMAPYGGHTRARQIAVMSQSVVIDFDIEDTRESMVIS
ncbi:MFS transporter [Streptosporangium sp. NPDC087985]|uniref:MFS transporter n=1 Tax=Streptosporangium sp. NPDC087985 TaxID=3366196 RepID=UPI0037FD5462